MPARQLVRVVAVTVAAVALAVLGWLGFRAEPTDADPLAATDPTSYAGVAAGVQRQLEVYGSLAETTVSHSQAHAYATKMRSIEQSLLVLRDRALDLDSEAGAELAALAEIVVLRGVAAQQQAADDHLGMTGIEGLNAFGREVSDRADALADATSLDELESAVAEPWPPPGDEGA